MVQRKHFAAAKDVPTKSKTGSMYEAWARVKLTYAAVMDLQIKSEMEECVLGMGQSANDGAMMDALIQQK